MNQSLAVGDVFTSPGLWHGDAALVTRAWRNGREKWVQIERADGKGQAQQILQPAEYTVIRKMRLVMQWVPVAA